MILTHDDGETIVEYGEARVAGGIELTGGGW